MIKFAGVHGKHLNVQNAQSFISNPKISVPYIVVVFVISIIIIYPLVIGFDQSLVHIGPSDAGKRFSFTANVLLSTPGAPDVLGLDYNISREPATLVNGKLLLTLYLFL